MNYLTTRDCADVLGVTTGFVRGEILDARLDATIIDRPVLPGHRRSKRIYRVSLAALREYCARWCPAALSKLPPAA